ncbi:MAG: tRNA uridine-5-carboxymethylaminomethyl(34) synthesis GTPase MnmE [Firmicutes bacterium]|nr:tRNA uridine-5-carboxymethylaminomethyl(34) synthesis GTPase MnmE [Bacillota bacterium]
MKEKQENIGTKSEIIEKAKIMAITIAACSTGFPGAIAVIRLSGNRTKELLDDCFFSKTKCKPRLLRTGKIDVDGLNDTATAVFFKAPDSYTGEDMAEISVHYSPVLVSKILAQLVKKGAEIAQKGEFTKRAFLNGKMDLTAAEAVVDIINAESEAEIKHAYRQIKGQLRQKIDGIQELLTEILAEFDAAIDFPEENIEKDVLKNAQISLKTAIFETQKLINSYETGKFIKRGVIATIIGGVNVGKSSLLNALLKKERAIVTDIPGTTRDTLEDRFEYKGQKFIITDTAGLRESKSKIEIEGIKRTKKAAEESDVIIAVTEAGQNFDRQTVEIIKKAENNGKKVILVENKIDIFTAITDNTIRVSAKTGKNVEWLKEALYEITARAANSAETTEIGSENGQKSNEAGAVTVTELRHYQSLLQTAEFLMSAEKSIQNSATLDLVASDFLAAYNELGRITGKSGCEDIIDTIFSRFCVGK